MMNTLRQILGIVSSLRLTLWCLAAAFVLVFAGTLAQVNMNTYLVQQQYFQSWVVWWTTAGGGLRIPVFPGGHLIGMVLLLNLITAHIRRFAWSWRKLGIQLIHFGIIVMLAGGLATDLLSVSSYMRLKEGETKNYSEDDLRRELAVVDLSDAGFEQVTAIPGERLSDGGTIEHASLPFKLVVRNFYWNSDVRMMGPASGTSVAASTQGAGARISVQAQARASKQDERDTMSAVLEVLPLKGDSLGTWLVSDLMVAPQEFTVDGRKWSLQLRPARYYKPYSLKLLDFTHETYPGTQIAKNFSSKVILDDPEKHENRQVQIYMNHPLRYRGETYYQSGFEPDNSGTVLQVVRNPSYQAPYAACIIVSLGLLIQFVQQLVSFARRTKPVPAP